RLLVDVLVALEDVLDVVQVARLRAQHARDLHEAPERDDADPVLRVAPPALDGGGREADVEAEGAHARQLRGREVPQLVDGDEQEQAEDGDRDAHAAAPTAPAASSRARRSTSRIWASDSTGSA